MDTAATTEEQDVPHFIYATKAIAVSDLAMEAMAAEPDIAIEVAVSSFIAVHPDLEEATVGIAGLEERDVSIIAKF